MKFLDAKEMLDYITDGNDLYNPETEHYVFVYDDRDSICVYEGLSLKRAKELQDKAKQEDEYWGAYLGAFSYNQIYDSIEYLKENGQEVNGTAKNLAYCEEVYQQNGWIDCKDVIAMKQDEIQYEMDFALEMDR